MSDIIRTVLELQKRAEYIAGLRALADLLDENTLLPLPYHGNDAETLVFCQSKEEVATYSRAMTGQRSKTVDDDMNYSFGLHGAIHGYKLDVRVHRDEVCEKVVLGTREVTEEIPDPTALAAVPTITVTKTVEDVRWDCSPLLAPSTS